MPPSSSLLLATLHILSSGVVKIGGLLVQCTSSSKWFLTLGHSRQATTKAFLWKKMFLEISQNSQENSCARVYFLLKMRLWHRCFPVNFAKFLRTFFLQNTSGGCFCIQVSPRLKSSITDAWYRARSRNSE